MITFNLSKLFDDYDQTISSWSNFFDNSSVWIKGLKAKFKNCAQEVGVDELINSLYELVDKNGQKILPAPQDKTYPVFNDMKQRILGLYDQDAYLQALNDQVISDFEATIDYLRRIHYLNLHQLLVCDQAVAQMSQKTQLSVSRYMETLESLGTQLSCSKSQNATDRQFKQDAYQTLKELDISAKKLFDRQELYQMPEAFAQTNDNKCQLVEQNLNQQGLSRDNAKAITQILYQHHDLCMIERVHRELATLQPNGLLSIQNTSTINRILCEAIKQQLIRHGKSSQQASAWAYAIERRHDLMLALNLLCCFINQGCLQAIIDNEQCLANTLCYAIKALLTQHTDLNEGKINRLFNIVYRQNNLTLADSILNELFKPWGPPTRHTFDQCCQYLREYLTQQTRYLIQSSSDITRKAVAQFYLDIAYKLDNYILSYKLKKALHSIDEANENSLLRECDNTVWGELAHKLSMVIKDREYIKLAHVLDNAEKQSQAIGYAIVAAISSERMGFAVTIYQELINDPHKTIASISQKNRLKEILQNYIGWGLTNKMLLSGVEYKRLRNTLIQFDDFEVLTHFAAYLAGVKAETYYDCKRYKPEQYSALCERALSRVLCDVIQLKRGGSSILRELTNRIFEQKGAFVKGELDFTKAAYHTLMQLGLDQHTFIEQLRYRETAYRLVFEHRGDTPVASIFANEAFSYCYFNMLNRGAYFSKIRPAAIRSRKRSQIEYMLTALNVKPQVIEDFYGELVYQPDDILDKVYNELDNIKHRSLDCVPAAASPDLSDDVKALLSQYSVNISNINPLLDDDPNKNVFDTYALSDIPSFDIAIGCVSIVTNSNEPIDPEELCSDGKSIKLQCFIDQYERRRGLLRRSSGSRSQFISELIQRFGNLNQVRVDQLIDSLYALFNEDSQAIPNHDLSKDILNQIKQAILDCYGQDEVLRKELNYNYFLTDSHSCNNYLRRIAYLNILNSLFSSNLNDQELLYDLNQLSDADNLRFGLDGGEHINLRRRSYKFVSVSDQFRQQALDVLRTIENAVEGQSNKLTKLREAQSSLATDKQARIESQLQSVLGFTNDSAQSIAKAVSNNNNLLVLQELESSLELVDSGEQNDFSLRERLKQVICNKVEQLLLQNNYSVGLASAWSMVLFSGVISVSAEFYLKLNEEGLFEALKYAQTNNTINQGLIDQIAARISGYEIDFETSVYDFNSFRAILSEECNSLLSETILKQVSENAAKGMTAIGLMRESSRQLVDYFYHELQYLAKQSEANYSLLLKCADIMRDQQDYKVSYRATKLVRAIEPNTQNQDYAIDQAYTCIRAVLRQRAKDYFQRRSEFAQQAEWLVIAIAQSNNVTLLDRVQKRLNNVDPLGQAESRILQTLICNNIDQQLKDKLNFAEPEAEYYVSLLNQPNRFDLSRQVLNLLRPMNHHNPRVNNELLNHFFDLLNNVLGESINNAQPSPHRLDFQLGSGDADTTPDNSQNRFMPS